jgi:hypothetical protein
MVEEHDLFLEALEKGKVITTAFLHELSADDDGFDDLLESSQHVSDAIDYDVKRLREAVERDRAILFDLAARLRAVKDDDDPKLAAVVDELARIAAEAQADAATALKSKQPQGPAVLLLRRYCGLVETGAGSANRGRSQAGRL